MVKFHLKFLDTYRVPDHYKNLMKHSERRKHCARANNFRPAADPFPGGRGMAKIKSAGDGHYLYLQTGFGEDRCTQFRVIAVLLQTHTHKQTKSDG